MAGKRKLLQHPKASDDVDEELITPGAKKIQPVAQKKPAAAKVRPRPAPCAAAAAAPRTRGRRQPAAP